MITSIEKIHQTCNHCKELARYKVTSTNSDLPERTASGIKYFREGIRVEHYCEEHMPHHAKLIWDEQAVNPS